MTAVGLMDVRPRFIRMTGPFGIHKKKKVVSIQGSKFEGISIISVVTKRNF